MAPSGGGPAARGRQLALRKRVVLAGAGANSFGAGAHCEIELPQHAALKDAGSFVLEGSQVLLRAAPGAAVQIGRAHV